MSDLGNQRRMAAAISSAVNRVWFDPERQADIEAAISGRICGISLVKVRSGQAP